MIEVGLRSRGLADHEAVKICSPSPAHGKIPLVPTPPLSPHLPHTENKKKCFFSFAFPHSKEEVCLEEHLFVCTMHTTQ